MPILNNFLFNCDAPRPWGVYFQDTASPQMEALVKLHDNIMFYLVIILFGVAWIMVSIIRNYVRNKISNKYLNHGTFIELIWTITPALILILVAFPSFKLLYLMDEVTDPSLTVFMEGHQWYWGYQYPDFLSDDNEELEFDSYVVPEFTCLSLPIDNQLPPNFEDSTPQFLESMQRWLANPDTNITYTTSSNFRYFVYDSFHPDGSSLEYLVATDKDLTNITVGGVGYRGFGFNRLEVSDKGEDYCKLPIKAYNWETYKLSNNIFTNRNVVDTDTSFRTGRLGIIAHIQRNQQNPSTSD